MKKLLYINFVILVFMCSCTVSEKYKKKNYIFYEIQPNGIKSIEEKSYKAIISGDSIIAGERSTEYYCKSDFMKYFDETGRIIYIIHMYSNDEIRAKDKYYYSLNRDTIIESHWSDLDYDTALYKSQVIIFDKNGCLLKDPKFSYIHYHKTIISNKNEKTYELYSTKEKFVMSKNFPHESDYSGKTTKFFDKKGNEIERIISEADGSIAYHRISSFNELNDEITRIASFPNEPLNKLDDILTYSFIYEYNEHGDWVKKIEYLNGEPTFIFLRKIVYY